MKILLLGGNGQVGRELRRSLVAVGQVIVATRDGEGADENEAGSQAHRGFSRRWMADGTPVAADQ